MRGSRARLRRRITLCDLATLRETCFFSREGAKPRRNEAAGCEEVEQDSDFEFLFATSRLCVKHVLFSREGAKPRWNEAAGAGKLSKTQTLNSSLRLRDFA